MSGTINPPRPNFYAKLALAAGAADVIEAGTDGLIAGTLQEVLQDLATRIQTLEDV